MRLHETNVSDEVLVFSCDKEQHPYEKRTLLELKNLHHLPTAFCYALENEKEPDNRDDHPALCCQ